MENRRYLKSGIGKMNSDEEIVTVLLLCLYWSRWKNVRLLILIHYIRDLDEGTEHHEHHETESTINIFKW